jgi:hypothetical protein
MLQVLLGAYSQIETGRLRDERLTATELVADAVKRSIILRQLERTPEREPERQKEKELAYGY